MNSYLYFVSLTTGETLPRTHERGFTSREDAAGWAGRNLTGTWRIIRRQK